MSDVTEPTVTHARWDDLPQEALNDRIGRRMVTGQRLMVAQVMLKKGAIVPIRPLLPSGLRNTDSPDRRRMRSARLKILTRFS